MTAYTLFSQTQRQRVSDGAVVPILELDDAITRQLVLVWSQLGDFDSLEYAWWLQRERDRVPEDHAQRFKAPNSEPKGSLSEFKGSSFEFKSSLFKLKASNSEF